MVSNMALEIFLPVDGKQNIANYYSTEDETRQTTGMGRKGRIEQFRTTVWSGWL